MKKQVLFVLMVLLTVVSTACGGASMSDATRNVLGTTNVATILSTPYGQTVDGVSDIFIICSQNGIVGIALPRVRFGEVSDVSVSLVDESTTACGVKFQELVEDSAELKHLTTRIKGGSTQEDLQKEVLNMERRRNRAQ